MTKFKIGDIVEEVRWMIRPNRLIVEKITKDWVVCFNTIYIGTDIVGRYQCHASSLRLVNENKLGLTKEHKEEPIKSAVQLSIFDLE